MKSFMASPSTVERKWYVVDAEGEVKTNQLIHRTLTQATM